VDGVLIEQFGPYAGWISNRGGASRADFALAAGEVRPRDPSTPDQAACRTLTVPFSGSITAELRAAIRDRVSGWAAS
jgi:hypothetical protein